MADLIERAARAAIEAMTAGVHPAQQAYIVADDLADTLIDGHVDMRAAIKAVLELLHEEREDWRSEMIHLGI